MSFIVIYSISYFLLIIAAVVFLRCFIISDALKELRGLTIEPHYNEKDGSISVKNNFDNFYFSLDPSMSGNYPILALKHIYMSAVLFLRRLISTVIDALKKLRIKEIGEIDSEPRPNEKDNNISVKSNFDNYPTLTLKRICADIEDGKNYNGAFYLSFYKKYHTRFLSYLFVASSIIPIIALIAVEDNLYLLLAMQFILYFLIGVLRFILARNFEIFTEIFYCHWYDKLLNFNAMRVSALSQKISAESEDIAGEEINASLKELKEVYAAQSEALSKSSAELALKLQELSDEKQKGNIITVETVIGSLDANFNRVETLCKNLETSGKTLENSYKELLHFTGVNEITLNAVNKLADEFAALRNALIHTGSAESAAIKQLNGISDALEKNINAVWTTVNETMQKNAADLFISYERFFELCKTISLNCGEKEQKGEKNNE